VILGHWRSRWKIEAVLLDGKMEEEVDILGLCYNQVAPGHYPMSLTQAPRSIPWGSLAELAAVEVVGLAVRKRELDDDGPGP
jgi:hypothetical protein